MCSNQTTLGNCLHVDDGRTSFLKIFCGTFIVDRDPWEKKKLEGPCGQLSLENASLQYFPLRYSQSELPF